MLSTLAILILSAPPNASTIQRITCPEGASFSGDGLWFQDNGQSLYEVATGRLVEWEQPQEPIAASYPKTGVVFYGSVGINFDATAVVYSRGYGATPLSTRVTYTEKGKGSLTEVGAVHGLSFSRDGKWMATRSRKGTILYDTSRGVVAKHPVWTAYSSVFQPLFTRDGRYCIAPGYLQKEEDGKPAGTSLVVLDLANNFARVDSERTKFVGDVSRALSTDGSMLLVYGGGYAMVLRFDQGGDLTPLTSIRFRDHNVDHKHVGLSRTEEGLALIVSASHYDGEKPRKSLLLWPLHKTTEKNPFRELITDDKCDHTEVATNADGTRAIYGRRYWNKEAEFAKDAYDWKWQLVKLNDGQVEIKDIQIGSEPVFHPDGKRFVAREAPSPDAIDGEKPPLALFDADTGLRIRRLGEMPPGC